MNEYNQHERTLLLQTARKTIAQHLSQQPPVSKQLSDYPEKLRQTRACFVTLTLHGQLRGCIGSLTAHQPLIVDVIDNAYNAAFRDPRFTPVTNKEEPQLELEISVLSVPQTISFNSEAELIAKLRPGIDGLILSDQGHHATFLPSVWEQLPDPVAFLNHLKEKADLQTNYWSNTISIETYTTELIS